MLTPLHMMDSPRHVVLVPEPASTILIINAYICGCNNTSVISNDNNNSINLERLFAVEVHRLHKESGQIAPPFFLLWSICPGAAHPGDCIGAKYRKRNNVLPLMESGSARLDGQTENNSSTKVIIITRMIKTMIILWYTYPIFLVPTCRLLLFIIYLS